MRRKIPMKYIEKGIQIRQKNILYKSHKKDYRKKVDIKMQFIYLLLKMYGLHILKLITRIKLNYANVCI